MLRLVCAAGGATGAGGAVAGLLQAMQRVVGELWKVLPGGQRAMVSLLMSMVRALQVIDLVMVPLVMPMAGEGAAGDAVGDGAVGDVDGEGAAGAATGDGDADVADGEGVACDVGVVVLRCVGHASGGDGLVMPMAWVLSVL